MKILDIVYNWGQIKNVKQFVMITFCVEGLKCFGKNLGSGTITGDLMI